MFTFENEAMLNDDRDDLIAVLQMRFGRISGDMIVKIYEMDDMHTLQRLIIAAANASTWSVFLQEYESGVGSYGHGRILSPIQVNGNSR